MLERYYSEEFLSAHLLSREAWHPYPTAQDRGAWEGVPAAARADVVAQGERALAAEWPALPATLFLDFARTGNRKRFEAQHFARRYRLTDLVLAECVGNSGRFMDAVADSVWSLCEETFWGLPAHLRLNPDDVGLPDRANPAVDLFAAETASLLALTDFLLGPALDKVSPMIRPRIAGEIERRILTPCLARDDFWWLAVRSGRTNNWTPWICSNWLLCNLLIERDPARRLAAVLKSLRSIDFFIDRNPDDGGCDEGPTYWTRAGASLFDYLDTLQSATSGAADVFSEPKVREMGRFIYRAHIAERWFVNFADAPARMLPECTLVYRFGRAIGDAEMMKFGAYVLGLSGGRRQGVDSLPRRLPALFTLKEMSAVSGAAPLPRDVWLPQTQVMVARPRAGSAEGLFLAAKGGHNAESHNHNDVGHFIIFAGGRPVLIDAGVETYSRKTFSGERYAIWTMQSQYHNLPTVNGVMQRNGCEFAARDVQYAADDAGVTFSLDLAGAYPPEAGIVSWRRTFRFVRAGGIDIEDAHRLAAPSSDVRMHLLTPCAVDIRDGGVIALSPRPLADGLTSGAATLRYPFADWSARCEEVPIDDPQMRVMWGERVCRIVVQKREAGEEGTFVLNVDRTAAG